MRKFEFYNRSFFKILQYTAIAAVLFFIIHHDVKKFAEWVAYLSIIIALLYAYRFLMENNKKNTIQKNLSKFVTKKVMQKIIKEECCNLGGHKSEITVLFGDIRDFTALSEALEPEEVSHLLNLFFSAVIPIVEKHNGSINKFLGDAFLAVFGDNDNDENHAKNAVLCGYELLQEMKKLRASFEKNGNPLLKIGIGINTGVAYIGNIGTEHHMEYTVIGDAVNIASRIESHNKLYNTKLLISEYTYNYVKELVDTIEISSVQVRGRVEPINIYEVIDILKKNG